MSGLKNREKIKVKRTLRRALSSRIINQTSVLHHNDSAMQEQLVSMYEMLKTNNNEMNKVHSELESLISDNDFQAEYDITLYTRITRCESSPSC